MCKISVTMMHNRNPVVGESILVYVHDPVGDVYIRNLKLLMFKDMKSYGVFDTTYSLEDNLHTYVANFIPKEHGDYYFAFSAEINGHQCQIRLDNAKNLPVILYENFDTASCWKIFVRLGFEGETAYQILPDRFFIGDKNKKDPYGRTLAPWSSLPIHFIGSDNSYIYVENDYRGGDLSGIMKKLSYLSDLGVSLLYLNPIFEAHSFHRYNTGFFGRIDPMLGTWDDLKNLCTIAKEKYGIRIILDMVFNHTGSNSVYFNKDKVYGEGGAFNDPQSIYNEMYFINRSGEKLDYKSWWGFGTLPSVNQFANIYRKLIFGNDGVIHRCIKAGVSGIRLDVADELHDDLLNCINECEKRYTNGDGIVVGEVWEDPTTKENGKDGGRRHFFDGQLDSVMNYPLLNAILSFVRYGTDSYLSNVVNNIISRYPVKVVNLLLNSLSTHDVCRAITMLAGKELEGRDRNWQRDHHYLLPEELEIGLKRMKVAYSILYFLPGIPCLYYGDEIGMSGYKDAFNRMPFIWDDLQSSTLPKFFKTIGKIRKENKSILSTGKYELISKSHDHYAFSRSNETGKLSIAINRNDFPIKINLEGTLIFSSDEISTTNVVKPYGVVISLL